MKKIMIKKMVYLLVLAWAALPFQAWAGQTPMRISGPPVAESLVFAVMADKTLFPSGVPVDFIPWNSPDQARALIAGEKIDGAIITTSAAACFFDRGVPVRIAGLFTTPLWVVSLFPVKKKPGPLAGRLLFPFGHREMPEILFHTVFGNSCPGLETLHTGGSLEVVNMLLLGRGDHALLAEPAATLAVLRSSDAGRKGLVKYLDINREWEKKFSGSSLYVSAFAVFGKAVEQPDRVRAVMEGYGKALEWIRSHPEKALVIAKQRVPALAAQAVNGSIPNTGSKIATGSGAFAQALFFLEKIFDRDPGAVGGKPPASRIFMEAR